MIDIKPRFDLWRKRNGIPADASKQIAKHNRKKDQACKLAKRPHLPRIVQRQLRLEAIAKHKKEVAARKTAMMEFMKANAPKIEG